MNYGLQLYSVRDAAEKDFAQMLRCVAGMGYRMVETAGFFGLSADAVAAMLHENGLTVSGTHTGLAVLDEDFSGTVKYHQAIGCQDLILPSVPLKTAEQLAESVRKINYYQPLLAAEGIRLHYHNHSREFLPNADGQIAQTVLAEETAIGFELDTFWAFNAGLDPLELMHRYAGRLRYIHLKDGFRQDFSDPDSKASGKALGEGEAPVAQVRRQAIAMGVGMVVESEGLVPTGLEEVQRCIRYLQKLDVGD